MFTGIILAIGTVEQLDALGGDYRLTFNTGQLSLDGVNIGDSIAVNGVCLTVIKLTANSFSADVSRETLSRTTLGQAKPGKSVNLELALAPTTRLGGHFVSGHVDGLGTVLRKEQDGRSFRFDIQVPQAGRPKSATLRRKPPCVLSRKPLAAATFPRSGSDFADRSLRPGCFCVPRHCVVQAH